MNFVEGIEVSDSNYGQILWDIGEFSIKYEAKVVFRDWKARSGDEMKAALGRINCLKSMI